MLLLHFPATKLRHDTNKFVFLSIIILSSDTEKTVNAGWGADTGTAELGAEIQGAADATAEAGDGWGTPAAGGENSGWDAPAADGGDAPAGEAKEGAEGESEARRKRREEEEEEDNTLTFDQYQAQKRAAELAALPKLEGQRTVGEHSEWKDAVQLLKEESEEVYFAGKVCSMFPALHRFNLLVCILTDHPTHSILQTKSAPKAKAKKEEKVYIAIDLPPPTREFRGGRGGDRGGRGRGGDRGGRGRGGDRGDRGGRGGGRGRGGDREGGWGNGRGSNQANVDVDDQSAFPSLS